MKHDPTIFEDAMDQRTAPSRELPDLMEFPDEELRVFDLGNDSADINDENLGVSFLLIKEDM